MNFLPKQREGNLNGHVGQPASLEGYGDDMFWGVAAEPYLNRQNMKISELQDPSWTQMQPRPIKLPLQYWNLQWPGAHPHFAICSSP